MPPPLLSWVGKCCKPNLKHIGSEVVPTTQRLLALLHPFRSGRLARIKCTSCTFCTHKQLDRADREGLQVPPPLFAVVSFSSFSLTGFRGPIDLPKLVDSPPLVVKGRWGFGAKKFSGGKKGCFSPLLLVDL